jgi:glycosidase
MFYGDNVGNANITSLNPSLKINAVHKVENPNYLFVDVLISANAVAGEYPLQLTPAATTAAAETTTAAETATTATTATTAATTAEATTINYTLQSRRSGSAERKGFTQADMIYLLMPDRFANGDTTNDSHPETREKANRKSAGGRHGGDIQGIIDHLDYIAQLGSTAIWSTPLTLDDEVRASYHGYAAADYYKIDPRFGTNELYRTLVQEAHKKDLKVIMDMVPNHCGLAHWWMSDLPSSDWVNHRDTFVRSTFQMATQSDPNGSKYDLNACVRGWFDFTMPDMNLSNPKVVQYLLQMALWWVEYADLDGLRVDTYPYSDKHGIATWTTGIMAEYPKLGLTGETWFHTTAFIAYWQKDALNHDGYNSGLPVPMDFTLQDNLLSGILEDGKTDWGKGLIRLHESLSQDFAYVNPNDLLIFAENHDVRRLAWQLKGSLNKVKMIYTLLATMRGIPQIYYGSELFMQNTKKQGDIHERLDMPGGWIGDPRNTFTAQGRTAQENELYDYISKLYQWRKTSTAVAGGKMMQFVPIDNNLYVYFRYDDNELVMTIINNLKEPQTIDWSRYSEVLQLYGTSGREIITGQTLQAGSPYTVAAQEAAVIEFRM